MRHRHLDYAPETPVTELGPAAIDDLLDRGTLKDWAPLAAAIDEDPWGEVSETVLRILDAHPMYGTGPLWRSYIDIRRTRGSPAWPARATPAELRRLRGRGQRDVGEATGMNQSEVSKFERRGDVLLSNLAAYARGTGGRLRIMVDFPDAPAVELRLTGEPPAQ